MSGPVARSRAIEPDPTVEERPPAAFGAPLGSEQAADVTKVLDLARPEDLAHLTTPLDLGDADATTAMTTSSLSSSAETDATAVMTTSSLSSSAETDATAVMTTSSLSSSTEVDGSTGAPVRGLSGPGAGSIGLARFAPDSLGRSQLDDDPGGEIGDAAAAPPRPTPRSPAPSAAGARLAASTPGSVGVRVAASAPGSVGVRLPTLSAPPPDPRTREDVSVPPPDPWASGDVSVPARGARAREDGSVPPPDPWASGDVSVPTAVATGGTADRQAAVDIQATAELPVFVPPAPISASVPVTATLDRAAARPPAHVPAPAVGASGWASAPTGRGVPGGEPPFLSAPGPDRSGAAAAGRAAPPPASPLGQVMDIFERMPGLAAVLFAVFLLVLISVLFISRADVEDDELAAVSTTETTEAAEYLPPTVPPTAPTTAPIRPTTTSMPPTTTSTTAPAPTTLSPAQGFPDAQPDFVQTDRRAMIEVLTNDTSPDSMLDVFSVQIVTQPEHAREAYVAFGAIVYRAERRFEGTDYLEYQVCDVDGRCSVAGVTIEVTG